MDPRTPKIASKMRSGQYNAAGFQTEQSSVCIRVEVSAADVGNGWHQDIEVILLKRCTNTIDVA